MQRVAHLRPAGRVGLTRLPRQWPGAPGLALIAKHGLPRPGLPREVNVWRLRNMPNLWRGAWRYLAARALRLPAHYGVVYLDVCRAGGERVPYGLASLRVVTDAGVNYIRDAYLNTTELENMKYHGYGTGTTAEAVGQTALTTELTTEYTTDNTRPTGSQASNGTGIYRTVATLDPDIDVAITEHGIFSQAATGGGTLLDRSKFSAVNLVGATGDTLQVTYDFTCSSGG